MPRTGTAAPRIPATHPDRFHDHDAHHLRSPLDSRDSRGHLARAAGRSSAAAQATTSTPLTLSTKNQINFGRVPVGTTAYQTVTLTNNNRDTAIVSGAGVSAETGAFGLVFETVTCGGTLPPGASCSWTIASTPPWRGKHVGQTDTLAATIAADGSALYTLEAKVKLIGWGT